MMHVTKNLKIFGSCRLALYGLTIFVLFFLISPTFAASPAPALGMQGMVVSQHPLASKAGLAMLESGGNAVDAAVATAFALGVVEQYHSGIGGGGFMIVKMKDERPVVIDFREVAPQNAHRDMYIQNGEANPILSRAGALACAVPGEVAGLSLALEKYGTKSLADVLAPSIDLAEEGFPLHQTDVEKIAYTADKLKLFPESARLYFGENEELPQPGDMFIQKELSLTYRLLAAEGPDAFYRGSIGQKIVDHIQAHDGIMTMDDLAAYEPVIREPVTGTYRGYEIVSMPPPSSGGVHLIQMLNMIEHYPMPWLGFNSTQKIHLVTDAMKFAFADRAYFLGDPAFVDVPVAGLLSKNYANALRHRIHPILATTVNEHGQPQDFDGETNGNTSHLSVIDKDGNCVSLTRTVNLLFGNGMVVPGTGIVLNNEMDDFSAQPGVPNAFGLIGGEANSIEPGKRPLSSMTPTIVLRDGEPALIVGSPGGPRIITTVLQVILNVLDHGLDVQSAVDAPRFHHQWRPDVLFIEQEYPLETIKNLKSRGHNVYPQTHWSAAQAIWVDPETGWFYGGSDSRLNGAALGY